MAAREIPFERQKPPTDSNTSTTFESPLVENFLKKVQPEYQNRYQDTNARTIKYLEGNTESSTSRSTELGLLIKQANLIFTKAKEEFFEDGMESIFSRNLSNFIEAYSHSAMEAIITVVLSNQTNSEVASEALRILGRLTHTTTYRERLWLLERGLYSESAQVRDGATLGLAFLDDPLAIEPLRSAAERENIPELRQDMEQVIAQLEGNIDGSSTAKDS